MRRGFIVVCLLMSLPSIAAVPRRAVSQPAQLATWTIEIRTSGGIDPSINSGVLISSTGDLTILNALEVPTCRYSLAADDLSRLNALVTGADPRTWASSYVPASNPTGCCDQKRTSVMLTRGPEAFQTYWFDDHPPLPADLVALHAFVFSTLRPRFESSCSHPPVITRWSIEIAEEGGFIYRYHRIVAASDGTAVVQPNPRTPACNYSIPQDERAQLDALIAAANPAAWAGSYVRADNPSGCCDQTHMTIALMRTESTTSGDVVKRYSTDWFSDHPPLPDDLTAIVTRFFSAPDSSALFQRLAPGCGPLF